jgi:hypothetical protein
MELEIINRALTKLGANTISSLDENSVEAKLSVRTYSESLESLLSELDWNFALKEENLKVANKQSQWRKGRYFELPADLLKICEVSVDNCTYWRQEGNYIFSTANSFGILYIPKNVNASLFPTYFKDALVYKLASDLCYSITNSSEKTMTFLELYKGEFLPIARTKNARAKSSPVVNDTYWVDSFLGGNQWHM